MGVSAIETGQARATALEQWRSQSSRRADIATQQALGRRLDPHDPEVIQRTAAQMVSELFYVPMLAEMRSFPFGEEFGNGGHGEAVFGEQLDQRVADIVASTGEGGLVDQVARYLEEMQHSPAQRGKAVGGSQTQQSADALLPQVSWLTLQQAQETPAQSCARQQLETYSNAA